MSGIRWRPTNIVQQISPEAKKSIQVYRFGRIANLNCCRINKPSNIIKYNFLGGGIPSAGGPALKNGGTPSAGGAKIYDGGKP